MKRQLARLLGTVLFAGLLLGGGVSAADTPGCVSRGEYDSLIRGLSSGQVANRFDTNGWWIGSGEERFRRGYEPCWTDTRKVVVWYSLTTGLSDDWAIRDD